MSDKEQLARLKANLHDAYTELNTQQDVVTSLMANMWETRKRISELRVSIEALEPYDVDWIND